MTARRSVHEEVSGTPGCFSASKGLPQKQPSEQSHQKNAKNALQGFGSQVFSKAYLTAVTNRKNLKVKRKTRPTGGSGTEEKSVTGVGQKRGGTSRTAGEFEQTGDQNFEPVGNAEPGEDHTDRTRYGREKDYECTNDQRISGGIADGGSQTNEKGL